MDRTLVRIAIQAVEAPFYRKRENFLACLVSLLRLKDIEHQDLIVRIGNEQLQASGLHLFQMQSLLDSASRLSPFTELRFYDY